MLLLTVYWLALIPCSGFALLRGKNAERAGATVMITGSIASVAVTAAVWGSDVELGIFGVDLLVLVALLVLSLRTDRLWPLWMTGFHLIGVATHAAMMLEPEVVPRAYSLAQGFWAYPMLIALVVGTYRTTSRDPAKPS